MVQSEDYIVCRCEEVTLSQVKKTLGHGLTTSQEVKMATRLGMGHCQGRICRTLIEHLLKETKEGILPSTSKLTVRKPVRPVHIEAIGGKGR